MTSNYTLTIDGEACTSEISLDVINPATGAVFARCPAAGRAHLERAVAAARLAFHEWSARSFEDRAAHIQRFADALKSQPGFTGATPDAGTGQASGSSPR